MLAKWMGVTPSQLRDETERDLLTLIHLMEQEAREHNG